MDDFLSNIVPEITKNIANFLTTEDERILFALSVPGGEQIYYNLRKDPEYWLEKIGKYSYLIPNRYKEDVSSLERFYNIFMLLEERESTKAAFKVCSSLIPELYNLIHLLLEKGDHYLNDDEDSIRLIILLNRAIRLYLQNVTNMSMVLVETLFQLISDEKYEDYVSEETIHFTVANSTLEATLNQNGKISNIFLIVDFLNKYFTEDHKKEFISEYLSDFEYTDYEKAKEIKDVMNELSKQGYPVEFQFFSDKLIPRSNFGERKDPYYFQELFVFLVKREFRISPLSPLALKSYTDNKIKKITKEPITLKFLLYLIFTTKHSYLKKIFDVAVLEENTLTQFKEITKLVNTDELKERLYGVKSPLAKELLSIL